MVRSNEKVAATARKVPLLPDLGPCEPAFRLLFVGRWRVDKGRP
jgi:hypothetical protein